MSSPDIEQVVSIMKPYGIRAKLTGAGGGGCVLGFYDTGNIDLDKLSKELNDKGYSLYQNMDVSEEGFTF